MDRRNKRAKGQALVLVTLALVAMCGMMGLAVDLGWSYLLKREAQSTADAAALAAINSAMYTLNITHSFTNPCNNVTVFCQTTPVECSGTTAAANGNLYNGCLYAQANGFSHSANTSQAVYMTANVGGLGMPPGLIGSYSTTNIIYWVSTVAVQTVPQLFSAILGNGAGTISANATAAISASAVPGSLITLNQPGDCVQAQFGGQDCGVDIHIGFSLFNQITATGSIIMASTCHNNQPAGCSSQGFFTNAYSGIIGSIGGQVTGSTIEIQKPGNVTGNTWTPTPTQSVSSGIFLDPTTGIPQPPLTVGGAMQTCGILNGQIGSSFNSNTTVGPYVYYAYSMLTGSPPHPVMTGAPITLKGRVTFSASGGCTGGTGSPFDHFGPSLNGVDQSSSQFPTYVFYGGLAVNPPNGLGFPPTVIFGPGQYVADGVLGSGNSVFSINGFVPTVQSICSPTCTTAYAGNMFIFTAPGDNYPGLATAVSNLPSIISGLVEGSVDINSQLLGTVNLTGVSQLGAGLPPILRQYNGVLFWQDRHNSTVQYDDNGKVISQTNPGHAVQYSNAMNLFGICCNAVRMDGVVYQPRGAFISDNQIAVANFNATVQIITGAVELGGFIGSNITLGTPTNRLIKYTPGLLQ